MRASAQACHGTVEYYFATAALVMLLWRGPSHDEHRLWLAWLPLPSMALVYLGWHATTRT